MKTTQCQRVVQYMKEFGSISTLEAFGDLGVTRLASRINDLKRMGYNITSTTASGKNRFGETTHYSVYRLEEEK